MELYKFVKDCGLRPNYNITYRAGESKETTNTAEIHGEVAIKIKSIVTFGIKGRKEYSSKNGSRIEFDHVIKGDDVPRMIYQVYKMGQPRCKHKREETLLGLYNVIESLHAHKKKYSKFSGKYVDEHFMFFACIEDTDGLSWPDTFLVNENSLDFRHMNQSLEKWNCISSSDIRVDNSNAYIKFETLPKPITLEKIMTCVYLHSVRKISCKGCSHVWSLQDLLGLLDYNQIYKEKCQHANSKLDEKIPHNEAYEFQNRHNFCELWAQFIKKDAFAQENDICLIS
ncbi:uncharacterized protein EV154DRAFT_490024 [Mucor mucedo]|uniref:uncharacterized protein n=1 Tax=Mucor mucedo TaxID=29922 RepID=UPI00222078A8|nr:uncharacterized protein EV154DRAFT_490024 [Mucor mucedo]KAI7896968.1 hypothetical protein EV154DRAFT_490024 [Mucor mucedo]